MIAKLVAGMNMTDQTPVLNSPIEASQNPRFRRGIVIGVVHRLDDRDRLNFTLYDVIFDRAITCYVSEERKDLLRGIWGERVTVLGMVARDPESGQPSEIKDIEAIVIAPTVEPGQFEAARGLLKPETDEALELTIERMRNSE